MNVSGPPISDFFGTFVSFTSVGGTATWPDNFDTVYSSLKFYEGEITKTLVIGIVSEPPFEGTKSFTVRLDTGTAYNIGSPSTITIKIAGALTPEITVEQPVSNDLVSSTASVEFDSIPIGTDSTTKTFTIGNAGSANLTGLAVTKSGAHASSFKVTSPTNTNLSPGMTATFTVAFSPTAAEENTAAIHIASNDTDENPFDIALSGTGFAAPEIAVEQPTGSNLTNGAITKNLGSVNVGVVGIPMTFLIKNDGSESLTDLDITLDGLNPEDYLFTGPSIETLAPHTSMTFNITFIPTDGGTRTATIHIFSNDTDEGSFDIPLTGIGLLPAPKISVEQPVGTNLFDGTAKIDFGTLNLGQSSRVFSFVIRNIGNANLNTLSLIKDGSGSPDFTVAGPVKTTLLPNEVTTFNVTFTPITTGNRSAAIHMFSNDPNQSPFDIKLTGLSILPAPEIVIYQPAGSSLTDGSSKKSFGTVKVGKTGNAKTFILKNTGGAKLTGLGIAIDGNQKKDFIIGSLSKTSLEPSASITFKVSFNPTGEGTRNANIHVKSNDKDENPFDIRISGMGAPK